MIFFDLDKSSKQTDILWSDWLYWLTQPPPPTHPPYSQPFVIFFGVRLTLQYDYMCPETDFTQEKKFIFIQPIESPMLLLGGRRPLRMIICNHQKGHEKCNF